MRNSTILVKKKICKTCKKPSYLFSGGNCKQCSTIKSVSRRTEQSEESELDESRSNIIADLDSFYSTLVRIKASNSAGRLNCFICNKGLHYKQACNHHYIQRDVLALRWDENNCHAGCYDCNNRHETDTAPYTEKMELWKKGITQELTQLSREVVKISTQDLKELLITVRQELKIAKLKLK